MFDGTIGNDGTSDVRSEIFGSIRSSHGCTWGCQVSPAQQRRAQRLAALAALRDEVGALRRSARRQHEQRAHAGEARRQAVQVFLDESCRLSRLDAAKRDFARRQEDTRCRREATVLFLEQREATRREAEQAAARGRREERAARERASVAFLRQATVECTQQWKVASEQRHDALCQIVNWVETHTGIRRRPVCPEHGRGAVESVAQGPVEPVEGAGRGAAEEATGADKEAAGAGEGAGTKTAKEPASAAKGEASGAGTGAGEGAGREAIDEPVTGVVGEAAGAGKGAAEVVAGAGTQAVEGAAKRAVEDASSAPGKRPVQARKVALRKVKGIGPKCEEILRAAGILTFEALANTSVDKLRKILRSAGKRFHAIDPSTWPEQAELAARGQFEALRKLKSQLNGGHRS